MISSYAINNYNSLTYDMGYAWIGVGSEKLDMLLYYNIFTAKGEISYVSYMVC